MYPEISLLGFSISTFGIMVASAFVICHYLLIKEFKVRNLDQKIAEDIVFYAALSAIIGSKIYYIIEKSFSDSGAFLSNLKNNSYCSDCEGIGQHIQFFGSGLTFNGGLICALIFISIYVYRKKLDFISLADIITPFILLGHGIGRIGCFLVGDDYGVPTNLPWGVSFPIGLPKTVISTFTDGSLSFLDYTRDSLEPYLIDSTSNESLINEVIVNGQLTKEIIPVNTILSVHPTQLYEMTLYFISFLIIKKFYNQISKTKGLAFSLYLILAGLSRFSVEFLRTNERYFLNLSSAQYISIIMIIFGLAFILYQRKLKLSN